MPEDLVKAYESIISIYDEQNRYEEINDLLLKCKDEEITARFQHYLALEPEYSYAKGSYDEVIPPAVFTIRWTEARRRGRAGYTRRRFSWNREPIR